jgi:hypothetical protein
MIRRYLGEVSQEINFEYLIQKKKIWTRSSMIILIIGTQAKKRNEGK